MAIQAVNPATGEPGESYPETPTDDIPDRIERADAAFHAWRRTSFAERAAVLNKAGQILRDNAESYARLMAEEMGKPASQGKAESEKCAWVCDYYAEHAAAFLEREPVDTGAGSSFVSFQPIGVVLAVMPWNFPFWQVFRFAAPALMAGNAGLLKHASNVPGCALAVERVLTEAGLPDGLFQTLLIGSGPVESIIQHPKVRAVTLTGSGPAGSAVAAAAGKALKKSVLELGGSDPYVILDDADVDAAAETCAASRLLNSGQSCIAAKRFIVVADRHDAFTEALVEAVSKRSLGDPLDEATDIGPLARVDLRDALHDQVARSISGGAECLLGGEVPDRPGAWYPASVLDRAKPGTPAYEEELFGPVASVISVRDEAEAIEVANATSFGLGAAVFTQDAERGRRIAEEELQAGACFVNDFVKSDPRLPFGGIKESGYGRELSHYGIREFVNIKTVSIA